MSDVPLPQEVLVSILLRLPICLRWVLLSWFVTHFCLPFFLGANASLKLNVWLERKFPYNFLLVYCRGQGVCVSGALYLLVNQIPDPAKNNLMVSYDLASQIFQLVPPPEYPDDSLSMDLGVLGGYLSVVCKCETYNVDIWAMREYGVKESWSKLVAFRIRNDMTSDFLSARPIIYLKKR
ncbi:hypothetical protein L1987_54522 [Smallanthus sonchifolius]|uniref:Uncharacterized protein n=1 Tax=Smallanthus sonchifolius TaxID=185202 RepID=A0ACB9E6V1_9ASTR|nr:hypothetical protein L1987_54522 [Smallanthus sonchifolius]